MPIVATRESPAIAIRDLWVYRGRDCILEDINLTVPPGDFLGLIGPNGGGKTTLFQVLLGLLSPQQGQVRLLGQAVSTGRLRVGYVPQAVHGDRHFPISVWEVVGMGRLSPHALLRRRSAQDARQIEQALRHLELWQHRHCSMGRLSAGQQQRAYLARALACNPQILLLDEPAASIDSQASTNIYALLQRWSERITVVMASHDIGVLASYVKTVGYLNRRLIHHGSGPLPHAALEQAYQCPIEAIAHGVPHRVFPQHPADEATP